jgi:replicative DNA helicase
MSKLFISSMALAIAVSTSTHAFAQDAGAVVTRAQVKAELIRLGHEGYNPVYDDQANYPEQLQAAEQQVSRWQKVDITSSGASTACN